jgi:hypothetical protein
MSNAMTVGDLICDLSLLDRNETIYIDADDNALHTALRVEIGYNTTAKQSIIILQTEVSKQTEKGKL